MPLERNSVLLTQKENTFEKICNALDKSLLENYKENEPFRFVFKPDTSLEVINQILNTYRNNGWDFVYKQDDLGERSDGSARVYQRYIKLEQKTESKEEKAYSSSIDYLNDMIKNFTNIEWTIRRSDRRAIGGDIQYNVKIDGNLYADYSKKLHLNNNVTEDERHSNSVINVSITEDGKNMDAVINTAGAKFKQLVNLLPEFRNLV